MRILLIEDDKETAAYLVQGAARGRPRPRPRADGESGADHGGGGRL